MHITRSIALIATIFISGIFKTMMSSMIIAIRAFIGHLLNIPSSFDIVFLIFSFVSVKVSMIVSISTMEDATTRYHTQLLYAGGKEHRPSEHIASKLIELFSFMKYVLIRPLAICRIYHTSHWPCGYVLDASCLGLRLSTSSYAYWPYTNIRCRRSRLVCLHNCIQS